MAKELSFRLTSEYITLGQLIKASDKSGSGAEAKWVLSQGGITVNGEPEDRRGRKLRAGDLVRFKDGKSVRLM